MSISIKAADSGVPQAVAPRGVVVRAAPPDAAPPRAAAPEERPVPKVDPQEMRKALQEAVERINDRMRQMSRNLAFAVDEKANRTVITVTNSNTGEVVRQIPNETVLELSRSIEDFKGLLHNTVN